MAAAQTLASALKLKLEPFKLRIELPSLLPVLEAVQLFEELVAADSAVAGESEVDVALWRFALYPAVDALRRAFQDPALGPNEKRRCLAVLDQQLLMLIGALEQVKLLLLAHDAQQSNVFPSLDAFPAQLAFRICSYLGDLYRYRATSSSTFVSFDAFSSAETVYRLAHRLIPTDGSVYNQLAVLESLRQPDLVSQNPRLVFYYLRALVCEGKPHFIARENLIRLLKKPKAQESPLFRLCIVAFESGKIAEEAAEELIEGLGDCTYAIAVAIVLAKYLKIEVRPAWQARLLEYAGTGSAGLLLGSQDLEAEIDADPEFLADLIGSGLVSPDLQGKIKSRLDVRLALSDV